jgi:hypothetical protein
VSAHGIAQAAIVFSVASVLCRCGVRVHAPCGTVLGLYRQHRALALQQQRRRRPPATVTNVQFTSMTKKGEK